MLLFLLLGLPNSSVGKESTINAGNVLVIKHFDYHARLNDLTDESILCIFIHLSHKKANVLFYIFYFLRYTLRFILLHGI